MKTLAFDLSMSCTGWALGDESKRLLDRGEFAGPAPDMPEGLKFLVMDREITETIKKLSPDRVIFAEFHNTPNMQSGHASLGLRAILLRRCEVMRIGCYPVSEISCRKKLGVNLSPKLTPEEEEDLKRRTEKWNLRGRKTSQPKPKRDMKARVAKVLVAMGMNCEGEDARDATVLILGSAE